MGPEFETTGTERQALLYPGQGPWLLDARRSEVVDL